MRTGQDMHTAVLGCRRVQCDPDPDDLLRRPPAEVRRVLMPRLFRPNMRRLQQRHILNQVAWLSHQSGKDRLQSDMERCQRLQTLLMLHEQPDFSDTVGALVYP